VCEVEPPGPVVMCPLIRVDCVGISQAASQVTGNYVALLPPSPELLFEIWSRCLAAFVKCIKLEISMDSLNGVLLCVEEVGGGLLG